MANSTTRILKFWLGAVTLLSLGAATACTTDDADPGEEETGGSGGTAGASGSSSTGGTSGTGGSSTTLCTPTIVLASGKTGIADFEEYDPDTVTDLSTWFFPLGGDAASSVLTGPYGYGDREADKPEHFQMVAGHDSAYAMSVSDSQAMAFGGGLGLWISECLDARAFTGISFSARGNLPEGFTKMSVMMKETTSTTIDGMKKGTCLETGTEEMPTCVHPNYAVPVTADWTEVRVPWTMFTGGKAMNMPVSADGRDIWQIQFNIGLVWVDDGTGTYVPTPAPYELAIDDVAFY